MRQRNANLVVILSLIMFMMISDVCLAKTYSENRVRKESNEETAYLLNGFCFEIDDTWEYDTTEFECYKRTVFMPDDDFSIGIVAITEEEKNDLIDMLNKEFPDEDTEEFELSPLIGCYLCGIKYPSGKSIKEKMKDLSDYPDLDIALYWTVNDGKSIIKGATFSKDGEILIMAADCSELAPTQEVAFSNLIASVMWNGTEAGEKDTLSIGQFSITDNGWTLYEDKYSTKYKVDLTVEPKGSYYLISNYGTIAIIDGEGKTTLREDDVDDKEYRIDSGFYFDPQMEKELGVTYGNIDVDRSDYEVLGYSSCSIDIPITVTTDKNILVFSKIYSDTGEQGAPLTLLKDGKGTVHTYISEIPLKVKPEFSVEFLGAIVFEECDFPEYEIIGEHEDNISDDFIMEYIDCEFAEDIDGVVLIEDNSGELTYEIVCNGQFTYYIGLKSDKPSHDFTVIDFTECNVFTDYCYVISGDEDIVKRSFEEICKDYDDLLWVTCASDYSYFYFDTNPFDLEDFFLEGLYDEVEEINKKLGFSEALMLKMAGTRALDGRQTEENDICKVSWTYHPDKGLEILYEKK